MAVKKKKKHRHDRHERARAHAERLAPPEERAAAHGGNGRAPEGRAYDDDTILVNSGNLNLPKDLDEDGDGEESLWFGFDPVVLVVFIFSLAFIVFIAWEISRTPPAR